jgi:mono/diheme cytochrome c family protein
MMKLKTLSGLLSLLNLSFFVLLSFLLLFNSKIATPEWMQPAGRMHALVLHLPIGFFTFHILLRLFKNEIEISSFNNINEVLLKLTGSTALISALFGLFLSTEKGSYNQEEIFSHKFTGYLFALGCYFYSTIHNRLDKKSTWTTIASIAAVMFYAGHKGAEITHGANYIIPAAPEQKLSKVNDESASVYDRFIYPIFEEKCVSCHNPQKTKGGLLMTDIAALKKGGENGPAIVPGDIEKSLVTKYILLPEDDELHMAPKGKKQLNENEINTLVEWVKSGASFTKKVSEYAANDPFAKVLSKINISTVETKVYSFNPASESIISELNTSYRTIKSLSDGSPALAAYYILADGFKANTLDDLSKIKEQLIHLNLSRMPIKNEDLSNLSKLSNLEKLILNETNITSLDKLGTLPNLENLSVMNSKVTGDITGALSKLKKLKNLYIARTNMATSDIEKIVKLFPKITIIKDESKQDSVVLTPPILDQKNVVISPNGIVLKHNIKGIEIRYTTDGSEVDSTSKLYTSPIKADTMFTLKARAFAKGWQSSTTMVASLFPKGQIPQKVIINQQPEAKRPGAGPHILVDEKRASSRNPVEMGYMGFRKNDFDVTFKFDEPKQLKKIKVSYNSVDWAKLYPPKTAQLFTVDDNGNTTLVKSFVMPSITGVTYKADFFDFDFTLASPQKNFKLVMQPMRKLPPWASAPGVSSKEPIGGIIIDEVFFY